MDCKETLDRIDDALERVKAARAKKDWDDMRGALIAACANSEIARANETQDTELQAALERI